MNVSKQAALEFGHFLKKASRKHEWKVQELHRTIASSHPQLDESERRSPSKIWEHLAIRSGLSGTPPQKASFSWLLPWWASPFATSLCWVALGGDPGTSSSSCQAEGLPACTLKTGTCFVTIDAKEQKQAPRQQLPAPRPSHREAQSHGQLLILWQEVRPHVLLPVAAALGKRQPAKTKSSNGPRMTVASSQERAVSPKPKPSVLAPKTVKNSCTCSQTTSVLH